MELGAENDENQQVVTTETKAELSQKQSDLSVDQSEMQKEKSELESHFE